MPLDIYLSRAWKRGMLVGMMDGTEINTIHERDGEIDVINGRFCKKMIKESLDVSLMTRIK